nr:DMT family transporter [Flexivirga oryzae]
MFAVMCVLWGISYLFIKVAVDEVSVPFLVFLRTGGGALVLLPLVARTGLSRAVSDIRTHWRWIVAFSAAEMIGPWFLLSSAEQRIDSGLAGLLIAGVPIVGIFVGRAIGDRERLGAVRWAGLLLGLLGVFALAAPALRGGDWLAMGEMALVVVGYALAPRLAARHLTTVPGLTLSAASLTIAGVVYLPWAIATWPHRQPSAAAWASLGALAIVCTATAFVAFFGLIAEVGPSRAMVFTYVNPAVAVVAGMLLLHEPFTAAMAVAFPLIIAGSVLATRTAKVAAPAPAPVG